jgi:hypothetical protein
MKTIETIELANATGGASKGTTELQEATTAVNVLGCYAQLAGAALPAGVTNPCNNLYPSTANTIRAGLGKPTQ